MGSTWSWTKFARDVVIGVIVYLMLIGVFEWRGVWAALAFIGGVFALFAVNAIYNTYIAPRGDDA